MRAPGSSNLAIAVDCAAAPGDYALAISGTSTDGTIRTTRAALRVQPFGTTTRTIPSRDTPISIPDSAPAAITSAIDVTDDLAIADLSVEVNITHPFIGDLVVQLVGPDGPTVGLHSREGGGLGDIHRTYVVDDFAGDSAAGQWRLAVSDHAAVDVGRLDTDTLVCRQAPPRP